MDLRAVTLIAVCVAVTIVLRILPFVIFGMFYPYFISILTRSCLALNFQQLFSTFIVTSKNPFQIGCTDGIFVFQIMFSYGLRSKCADLRNSYNSHSKKPLYFSLINW